MSDSSSDWLADVAVAAAEIAVEIAVTYAIDSAVASLTDTDNANPEASKTNVRQPRPVRRYGCGTTRVSGAYALRRASGKVYAQVYAWPEGPVGSYGRNWITEDQVPLEGVEVQSIGADRYETGRAKIYSRQGMEVETAYSELTSGTFGWTENHRGDGVPSTYFVCEHGKSEDARKQFPAGVATDLTREASYLAYDWRKDDTAGGDGDQRRYADDATPAEKDAAYATWEVSKNPVVWFVNIEWRRFGADWETRFAPVLDILTAAADVCDEAVLQRVGATQVTGTANKTSPDITLDSVAGIAAGTMINVAGMELEVTSVAGNVVNVTPSLPADAPYAAPVRWINDTPVYAPRYEVGFWWTADTPRKQVREWLRQSMDGWFGVRRDGAYIIRAGSYEAPTVIFGEQEIQEYSFDPGPMPGEEAEVYTTGFDDPVAGYTKTDTDSWLRDENADASTATDLTRKGVQNNSQARRLAKAAMDRAWAARVTVRTPFSARRGLGERYIGIRISEETDLNDAVLEITEAPRIEFSTASIVWTGRLANPARYDWNAETEEGNGPVSGYTAIPESLPDPSINTITVFFEDSGSGPAPRMRIAGTGPDRDDLNWFYRYRPDGLTSWSQQAGSDTDATPDFSLDTIAVSAVPVMQVQVAYETGGGTLSSWAPATPFEVDTTTDSLAPGQPTDGASASPGAGQTHTTWRNPTSSNFDHARIWRGGAASTFGTATSQGTVVGAAGALASFDQTGVAAGSYRYWITAENAADTASSPIGPFAVTVT